MHRATAVLTLPLLLAAAAPAAAEAPAKPQTADEILDRVAEQPTPKSSAVRMRMELISERGGSTYTQERAVEVFAKQADAGLRTLLRFTEPKDVAGVALLVVENPDAANDQYLYMPALKQEPKRISGGQKNASFLGTDFTFADLEGRDPEEFDHKLLGEETIEGQATWKIESTPKADTESAYTKLVQWIRQDVLMPVKIEFYERSGLLKVLTVQEIAKVDGYQIAKRSRMENVVKKHATVLEIVEQKNDLEIPDTVFTTREMKRR